MVFTPEEITSLITKSIPDAEIQIQDIRGDGRHYALYVASGTFNGLNRIDRHRMVFKALGNRTEKELESLTIQTDVREN